MELLLDEGALPQVNEAGDKGRILVPEPQWNERLRRQVLDVVRPDAEAMLAYMGKPLDSWDI